jgi:hypothetical protein
MTNLFIYLFIYLTNGRERGSLICTSPMTTGFFVFSPKGPLVQSPAPLSTGPEQRGSQYVNSEPKQFNTILST